MYKILLFKDLLTLNLLSMSMYSLKEKCKVCGGIIKCNEVIDNRPLLKSDKVPSKVIENLVDWTKDYDGCCQLLLSPYNWSSIGVSLPPMAVRVEAPDLLRIGFSDFVRAFELDRKNSLYTGDFCNSDCLLTYGTKFEEFMRISTVWVPGLTADEIEECLECYSKENGDIIAGAYGMVPFEPIENFAETGDKGTTISLDHTFSTVFYSLDILYAGGGLGHLPGFSFFEDRKQYISLKALNNMLDIISNMESQFPSYINPKVLTEQNKIRVLKWILHKFGYNIDRCSKRRTVLAAVEKHELSVISFKPNE